MRSGVKTGFRKLIKGRHLGSWKYTEVEVSISKLVSIAHVFGCFDFDVVIFSLLLLLFTKYL